MKLTKTVQTCSARPSQWDAWDESGQCYYVRYRWGWLTVSAVSGPDWSLKDEPDPDEVISIKLGGDLDGELSTEEMLAVVESQP